MRESGRDRERACGRKSGRKMETDQDRLRARAEERERSGRVRGIESGRERERGREGRQERGHVGERVGGRWRQIGIG